MTLGGQTPLNSKWVEHTPTELCLLFRKDASLPSGHVAATVYFNNKRGLQTALHPSKATGNTHPHFPG